MLRRVATLGRPRFASVVYHGPPGPRRELRLQLCSLRGLEKGGGQGSLEGAGRADVPTGSEIWGSSSAQPLSS